MALSFKKIATPIAAALIAALALTGCSSIFGGDSTPNEVTIVTHDSAVFT